MTLPKTFAPVALFIFNRPEETKMLVEALRTVAPKKIFVIADGPRRNKSGEYEKCNEARNAIASIDWPCEIETNFSDHNLGCRERIVSGMNWLFLKTDRAIILEDDCIPTPSFFKYCDLLLERYKNAEDIGIISGTTLDSDKFDSGADYYFSNFPRVWGWATWARTWSLYDAEISNWPDLRDTSFLSDFTATKSGVRHWRAAFDGVYSGKIDTWDYQLVFAHWLAGLKVIAPNKNLVKNIGFGPDATHTANPFSTSSNLETHELSFPLRHPNNRLINTERDNFMELQVFQRGINEFVRESILQIANFFGVQDQVKKIVISFLTRMSFMRVKRKSDENQKSI